MNINTKYRPIVTHIDTLSWATPKSRRRVRVVLGEDNTYNVTPDDVIAAQAAARGRERAFHVKKG